MTTEKGKQSEPITVPDDPFFDVDLIEVDDLINNARQLLDEVYTSQYVCTPIEALSPREDAMQQVQRFLSSIREPEVNQDDDVVFVAARPGNALPSNARTTAIVDLCSPAVDNEIQQTATRRRSRSASVAPQSLFQGEGPSPPKSRRRQPKTEPGTKAPLKPSTVIFSPVQENTSNASIRCPVCMDNVTNRKPTSTACGHIFCQECIQQAIRVTGKCPICNGKLRRTQIHRLYF